MDDDFATAAEQWAAILEDSTTALYATAEDGILMGMKFRLDGRKTFIPRIVLSPDLSVRAAY